MNNADNKEYLDLAASKIAEHEISAALELLNKHINEEDGQWLELAGECYFRLGDFKQAQVWWGQAREIKAANQAVLKRLAEMKQPSFQFWMKRFDEAIDQMERKNYAAAMAMLQELKVEQDGFVRLYQLLGLCYLATGDCSRAQQAWRRGLDMDQNNVNLLGYLAAAPSLPGSLVHVAAGKPRFAGGEKKTLTVSPGLLIAGAVCLMLLITGVAMQRNTVPREAQQMEMPVENMLASVENDAPTAAPVMDAPVMETFSTPNYAEEDLGGSDYDPGHERFYYEKGYNAYLQADYRTAASNLGVVVAMGSQSYLHREALYYLARVSYLQKDYAQAERLYNNYLKLFPNSNYYDDSLFYLGCTYYYQGEPEKTRDCFQRLKDLNQPVGYQSTPIYYQIMKQ